MKIRRRPVKKARIEIIPMIDVVFFLLVFFMVSSLSMSRVNSMQVALPKTEQSSQAMQQKVVLTVKNNGDIFVNKEMVTLETLGTELSRAMKDDVQEALLVNADEMANYGLVIKAMDQARKVGVRKFALATEAHGK